MLYGAGEPERVPLGRTTSDLFGRVLRATPLIGRIFDDDDGRSGERVVLLTEDSGGAGSVGTPRWSERRSHWTRRVTPSVRLAGFDVDGWRLMGEDDKLGSLISVYALPQELATHPIHSGSR